MLDRERLNRRYDIAILGASGFTGGFVAQYVFREAFLGRWERFMDGQPLRWALAGRSQSRLNAVLDDLSRIEVEGRSLFNKGSYEPLKRDESIEPVSRRRSSFSFKFLPTILQADIADDESLNSVLTSTNVVINCIGPFRFHGEKVLKTCIECGTHYVDICGETEWMERMTLLYDDLARQKGVRIVFSCGFDAAASELGLLELKRQFALRNAIPTQVDMFLELKGINKVNFATYESAVQSFANMNSLRRVRKQLYSAKLIKPREYFPDGIEPDWWNAKKSAIHKEDRMNNQWCMPYVMCDKAVVRLGQALSETRYDEKYMHATADKRDYDNERSKRANQVVSYIQSHADDSKSTYTPGHITYFPVRFGAYILLPSFLVAFAVTCVGLVFNLLAKSKFGRSILLNNPSMFTGGFVSLDRPDIDICRNVEYIQTFIGTGYTVPGEKRDTEKLDLSLQVKGPDFGYVSCSVFAVMSAMTLLRYRKSIPSGIHTPSSAFSGTPILSHLRSTEIFEFNVSCDLPVSSGNASQRSSKTEVASLKHMEQDGKMTEE